jgi:hypothetical protein
MAEEARAAVYYPHTGVRTVSMLKEGLLLWDQVEYIAPYPEFQPTHPLDIAPEDVHAAQEAMELLLVRHVPSESEKTTAHETLSRFAGSDLAERLRGETVNQHYLIYPEKFSEATWHALERAGLANLRVDDPDGDYEMPSAVGLVMMSVLAEACAGTLKRTITDQRAAYTVVRESIIKNVVSNTAEDAHRHDLLDVTLRLAALDGLPLKKLVELRQREAKTGGHSLKELRHKFVSRVDEVARQMTKHPRETAEVQRQFESDMADDLKALTVELGEVGWKAVFSRELAVGMLSSAGFLDQPVGQMIAGLIGLVGLGIAYRRERKAALTKHAMSWLYLQH